MYTKRLLSGSTDGKSIMITATATPGTIVHTGSSTATDIDEIWIYAVSSSANDMKVTLEWGSTTPPEAHIEYTVTQESGLHLLAPGIPLKGNATPLVVRAFTGGASHVNLFGFVNRIDTTA
tara:strand:- start:638 stop:1000 length:363 start_codon:yes stop_codon:yes gene_type:complete